MSLRISQTHLFYDKFTFFFKKADISATAKLLYCLLYEMETGKTNLVPEVLKIRELFKGSFDTKLQFNPTGRDGNPVENFADFKDEFVERLTGTIKEMFNPEVPFTQCTEVELCKYCAFKSICRR